MASPPTLWHDALMGWGLALLVVWAVGITGAFLWLLARTVAKAASQKRHGVFSHLREVDAPPCHMKTVGEEEYWIGPDGNVWLRNVGAAARDWFVNLNDPAHEDYRRDC